MTVEEREAAIRKIFEGELLEILRVKGADYGADSDCMSNLREFGFTGVVVRLSDKFHRLMNFTKRLMKGDAKLAVKDESLEDTIKDAINYLFFALILWREGKEGKAAELVETINKLEEASPHKLFKSPKAEFKRYESVRDELKEGKAAEAGMNAKTESKSWPKDGKEYISFTEWAAMRTEAEGPCGGKAHAFRCTPNREIKHCWDCFWESNKKGDEKEPRTFCGIRVVNPLKSNEFNRDEFNKWIWERRCEVPRPCHKGGQCLPTFCISCISCFDEKNEFNK